MIAEGALMPQNRRFKIREAGGSFFHPGARRQTSWSLLLYLFAAMASASAQTAEPVPNVEAIVGRMAQARADNRARLRPYIVTRNYKLFGMEESKAKSDVIADVAFVPPDSKEYTIQQTSGNGLGQMIVRRMLANEAEVAKDHAATDISAENYDFRFIREDTLSGQRCYVLELLARRQGKNLLRGSIWVDANTYLLRRFAGELAKTPSWWVRDVGVTFVYGDVSGMWLLTASQATARVRILGPCTMVSHDVKYKITELVADGSSAQANFFQPMLGRSLRHHVIPRPAK
jgi:hypothetical protein